MLTRCCFPKRPIQKWILLDVGSRKLKSYCKHLISPALVSYILVGEDVKGPTSAHKITTDQTATAKPVLIVAEQAKSQTEWMEVKNKWRIACSEPVQQIVCVPPACSFGSLMEWKVVTFIFYSGTYSLTKEYIRWAELRKLIAMSAQNLYSHRREVGSVWKVGGVIGRTMRSSMVSLLIFDRRFDKPQC